MRFLENKQYLRNTLFGIACIFVYSGAVNLGRFGFIPAIPFLGLILFLTYKWKKSYLFLTILIATVCTPLYILKKEHGFLFHPALEREFTFNQGICLTEYALKNKHFVLASKIPANLDCDSSNIAGAIKSETLPIGTKLKVKKVSVSHADLGEWYVIHADTRMGELALANTEFAEWPDGKIIEQEDLRRTIFYLPSLLMFWPITPVFFGSIFYK